MFDHLKTPIFLPRFFASLPLANRELGDMQIAVAAQNEYLADAFYCVMDYCNIRSDKQAIAQHRQQTQQIVINYLALGLDPAKAVIYRQSDTSKVFEMLWILTKLDSVIMKEEDLALIEANSYLENMLLYSSILAIRPTVVSIDEELVTSSQEYAQKLNTFVQTPLLPIPSSRKQARSSQGIASEEQQSFQESQAIWQKDLDTVEDILRTGSQRVQIELEETMALIRESIGFGLYERFATA